MYKTVPFKIGTVSKDADGYGIVADGYPIYGFGKTLADAHVHFLKACYAYMRHVDLKEGPETTGALEERLLVG